MACERPAVVGYVRAHLLMTPAELVGIKDQLVAFAAAEGYTLGRVFTEHAHTVPEAFRELVDAVIRDKVEAVVVPSLHHLGVLGSPLQVKDDVEFGTGARVLVAAPWTGGAGVLIPVSAPAPPTTWRPG
jgi:hypothetical protein